jgi:hypothetical protein
VRATPRRDRSSAVAEFDEASRLARDHPRINRTWFTREVQKAQRPDALTEHLESHIYLVPLQLDMLVLGIASGYAVI